MSEYIKREDAIREAKAWSMFGKDDLVSRLERLPSVEIDELIECWEENHKDFWRRGQEHE